MSTTLTSDTAESAAERSGKRSLVIGGIVVIVVGVIAAALLAWAATQRHNNAVEGLARAPVGCDTTLEFTATGEFYVFTESAGNFGDLPGDCDATGEFSLDRPDPAVELELIDPGGDAVTVRDTEVIDYDASGFVGRSIGAVDVEQTGDYVLRASSPDGEFTVAVGRDPDAGVSALRGFAVASLLAGLILGGLLLVFGFRRTAQVQGPGGEAQPEFDPTWAPTPSAPPHAHPGADDSGLPEPPVGQRPFAAPPVGVPGEALSGSPAVVPSGPPEAGPAVTGGPEAWSPPAADAGGPPFAAPTAPPSAPPRGPVVSPPDMSEPGISEPSMNDQSVAWSDTSPADVDAPDVGSAAMTVGDAEAAEPGDTEADSESPSPWAPPSV